MTRWLDSVRTACILAAGLLIVGQSARAQTSPLGAARDLYAAASYDDALNALNALRGSARAEDIGVVEEYRAFCLIALGRASEAESAIEAAVTAAPFARPSESDASPGVRSKFREVRRRALPAVIERRYSDAKTAFDRRDPTAGERFTQVLALIADPDLTIAAEQARLSQLRAMATDFLVLSAPKSSPPTPLQAQRAPVAPVATPAARDVSRVYSIDDVDVVPPSAVRQSLAPLADVFAMRSGSIEIVIDEVGAVTTAMTRVSVNAVYDRLALSTAKSWRYRPAVLNGVAVKYRMLVQLQLPPKP